MSAPETNNQGNYNPLYASKEDILNRFHSITWEQFVSAGSFLSAKDLELLRKGEENPVDYVLADPTEAANYISLLLRLVVNLRSSNDVQKYLLTKIEDIVREDVKGRAHLFLGDDGRLNDKPFLTAMAQGETYCKKAAATSLALLLTVCEGNMERFISILCEQLSKGRGMSGSEMFGAGLDPNTSLSVTTAISPDAIAAVAALATVLRNEGARVVFGSHGGVGYLTKLLKSQCSASGASAQFLYEVCFCLWVMTLGAKTAAAAAAAKLRRENGAASNATGGDGAGGEVDLLSGPSQAAAPPSSSSSSSSSFSSSATAGADKPALPPCPLRDEFLPNGTVPVLCETLAAAPREKVIRVALSALRNLTREADPDDDSPGSGSSGSEGGVDSSAFIAEMIQCGLVKTLKNLQGRQWSDPDIMTDINQVYEVIMRNYHELSTMERYSHEVKSGALRWGVVHTEKFWRENAKQVETDDFDVLRRLAKLLKSEDDEVVSIACYDIGEWTRFYPNGRHIVRTLGAKDVIMKLIDHPSSEVARHALLCVSKIMVNKWEYVK